MMRMWLRSLFIALLLLGPPLLIPQSMQATVNEVTARNDAVGNGSVTAFTYSFRILTKTDIDVLVDGTVKTVDTDYTVSGLGASGGGTVTFTTAPANGKKIALLRKQAASQTSVYLPNEALPAARIEKDLDKLQMQVQQLREMLQRRPELQKHSLLKDVVVPEGSSASDRAKKFLRWNAAGTGLEILSQASDVSGVVDSAITCVPFASLPAAGTAGRLRCVTDDVRGIVTDTGTLWRFLPGEIANAADFGASPTASAATNTTALQAALNLFSGTGRTGAILLPEIGNYDFNATLTYIGTAGSAITIFGTGSPGRTPSGAVLRWTGAAGGTMVQTKGGNQLLFYNLALNGNSLALRGFEILSNEAAGGAGSSGVKFENVFVGGLTGAESACFKIGDSTFQVSELVFRDVFCQGLSPAGTTYYGILTQASNVKNFRVFDGDFTLLRYGITHGDPSIVQGGSGYLTIIGASFNGNTVADVYGAAQTTTLKSCGSESSKMFFTSLTGSGKTGHLSIEDSYWDGTAASDDVIIRSAHASIYLQNNDFYNRRTASTVPKIEVGNADLSNEGPGGAKPSIVSINNYYHNAIGTAPVYDSAGTSVFVQDDTNYIKKAVRLFSLADGGGDAAGVAWRALQTVFGPAPRLIESHLQTSPEGSSGVTYNAVSEVRKATTKVTITKDRWIAAALTQDFDIFRSMTKTRILSIIADTTEAYAGLAGTIQLQMGTASGGTEYILAHDVKTAVITKGLVDADLGASINRANAVQGGVSAWTGDNRLWVRVTSGTGNLGTGSATNLTAGSTTFYITFEVFP